VLQKKPDSVKALVLMSNILEKQGEKKRLKETYEKLLILDPNSETLIYNLGVIEYETANYPKSIPYFERYVKLHPQEVPPHRYLFDIYKNQKKDALAFAEAKTLVSLNPKEVSPYHFIFEYLNTRGSFKEMVDVMKIGVSYLPDNTDLREYLILAYLKIGNEDLALQEMNELLKLKPKDVSLLLQVAKLREKRGKDKEALDAYGRILDISPGLKEAREAQLSLMLRQARLEEKEGNIKEALSLYKKMLDAAPGNEEAAEAYLRLRIQELPVEKEQ
jgi:tetratricopeptide (TPR) repeat protein